MPSFPGVPAFDVTTLPSIPTIPGFPDVPSWVFGAAIAEEAGVQLPTAGFGEFSFPTLEAGATFADLITVPEGLEGTAACSALWVPGNLETCCRLHRGPDRLQRVPRVCLGAPYRGRPRCGGCRLHLLRRGLHADDGVLDPGHGRRHLLRLSACALPI